MAARIANRGLWTGADVTKAIGEHRAPRETLRYARRSRDRRSRRCLLRAARLEILAPGAARRDRDNRPERPGGTTTRPPCPLRTAEWVLPIAKRRVPFLSTT